MGMTRKLPKFESPEEVHANFAEAGKARKKRPKGVILYEPTDPRGARGLGLPHRLQLSCLMLYNHGEARGGAFLPEPRRAEYHTPELG